MSFIARDHDAAIGGKARALASLAEAELPIPEWFAITPDAFHSSLTSEQEKRLESARDAEAIRDAIASVRPSLAVEEAIHDALVSLSHSAGFAVRSSASDEDGTRHSFAGQLDSFLFVRPEEVLARVIAVWQSGFSERIVAYRRENGLPLTPRAPAVLVQRMVDAEAAGVAFGADPVTGQRRIAVVSAVLGLGSALVSGDADADTWRVDQEGRILDRSIAMKCRAHRAGSGSEEGVVSVEVPAAKARLPALNDEQVREVADLVRQCGRHFGRPQDIEWALVHGQIFLLQSRPITSLNASADPDGAYNLWDNSNIAESYNGVTTPLTFSFARKAYEEVYRQFCRILAVPELKIAASDHIFRHMLGLIRGRVYYNLLSWYRLLTLLPGFKANRGFMEQMMGVKEALPEELVAAMTRSTLGERLRDRLHLTRGILAMIRQHWTLRKQIRGFYQRLDKALGKGRPNLDPLRPDELVAYYRRLESQLLTRWDAPLVNDFFAMIFYGMLGKLTRKWCGDTEGTLQNDLLCGEGGMISAEPAQRVRQLADLAAMHPELTASLCDGSLRDIREKMSRVPTFRVLYEQYLEKFGDRCLEELKLESPTLFDDPLTLLHSVGQLARRIARGDGPVQTSQEAAIRRRAEERVQTTLGHRPIRRRLFGWVLKHARARVRDRENLRFERTRLFGRVRHILLELGRKLNAVDLLDHPRDVFFLEVEEVLGFVSGTATTTDLKGLVAVRKAEFAHYRESAPPADRFVTRGMVAQGQSYEGNAKPREALEGQSLKGLGCCPGIVRGPVRVITDPRNALLKSGEILVAERTDLGWIMLFPSASGLLVERGSLLSHSAIVARELGIPAIVSLTGVTRWVKDGDVVELDGSTGVVTRVSDGPG